MSRRIVIVGGGVTGVTAFAAAVRHRCADRIDVVDPLPPGTGTAFATDHPALLCNTSVGIMSLLPDDPHDFLRHLHERGVPAGPDDVVARGLFHDYVRVRYADHAARFRAEGGVHRHIRAEAARVHRDVDGGYHVVAGDHVLPATDVLVCLGYGEPVVPAVLAEHVDHELIFRSPFPADRLLAALPRPADVLVLGTRLSAVDAAVLLCGQGHAVTLASPSGRLPAVRSRTGRGRAGLVRPQDITALGRTVPSLYADVLALA
ncbi:FAD/NAD(P)-binding protein, partial [Actinosynnema sp. NPDC023658]|uniref:FAD/NAD(P)-binding protein n=1 Tax=Actinosynnema sp. NPDC023658 TaxID=3155465 RepID=UPI0033F30C57